MAFVKGVYIAAQQDGTVSVSISGSARLSSQHIDGIIAALRAEEKEAIKMQKVYLRKQIQEFETRVADLKTRLQEINAA